MNHRAMVRSVVGGLLDRKRDPRPFTDSDSLVLSGRLDSFDVLDIVMFLEQCFRVEFGDGRFDTQEIDSVDEIAALIEDALQQAP